MACQSEGNQNLLWTNTGSLTSEAAAAIPPALPDSFDQKNLDDMADDQAAYEAMMERNAPFLASLSQTLAHPEQLSTETQKSPAFSPELQVLWDKAQMLAAENNEPFSTLHVLHILWRDDPNIHRLFEELFKNYGRDRRLSEIFGTNAVIPGASQERFEEALVKAKRKPVNPSDLAIFRNRLTIGARFDGIETIKPYDVLEIMAREHGSAATQVLENVFLTPRMTIIAERAHSLKFK